MGLLLRANESGNKGVPRLQETAESIVTNQCWTPESLDFPHQVFHAYRQRLGFSKGALFFREEESFFSPWLTIGLDCTSRRRLQRTPPPEMAQIPVVEVSKTYLQPYLSGREWGLLEQSWAFPFFEEEQLWGYLMVFEKPFEPENREEITQDIHVLYQHLAPLVAQSRFTKNIPIPQRIQASEKKPWESGIVLSVSFDEVIQAYIQRVPEMEPYRAAKDLYSFVAQTAQALASSWVLNGSTMTFYIPEDSLLDADLFLHQLQGALSGAFSPPLELSSLPFQQYRWPQDASRFEQAHPGVL
ncbi:MAG: hypothetical protein MI717_07790 [Spirochaetales bacterium]|nr:hypothetical protein [Spirochaetales bacterium]